MHRRISKKIFIYLFIFLILVTANNTKLSKFNFPKVDNFEIFGVSELENKKIQKSLKEIKKDNIFSLNKERISEIINSNNIVERYFIFKNYPSKLKIKIEKTNFLAITKKNNIDFYIGSNGNLIKIDNTQKKLPFVFGNIDIEEFLNFKKIIDNSNFSFNEIKNFYYFKSKRWDFETKDGLTVKLPFKDVESSLNVLSKIFKKEEFKNMKIIDLRQTTQVILNG